jgi:hypothetical protein
MAAPRAFACRNRFDIIPGNLTQFTVSYQCIIGDGINPGIDFAGTFTYDATQTPAANLTAAKNAIISTAASLGFAGLAAANILIDITMN